MTSERTVLTLGALHRALSGLVAPGPDATVTLHYEQRSVTLSESQPANAADLAVSRRFDAHLVTSANGIVEADMSSGGISPRPTAWVSVFRDEEGTTLYTIDGLRFGRFDGRLDLFDRVRFERRLDDVVLDDVFVDTADVDGESVVVLDLEVRPDSFQRLLQVFTGEAADDPDDLALRSYSLSLSAARQLSLEYWWSLAGDEPIAGAAYRHTVACHVAVHLAPSHAGDAGTTSLEPSLPPLRHIDEVWDLARAVHTAGRAPTA
jgi:hypothetical protein